MDGGAVWWLPRYISGRRQEALIEAPTRPRPFLRTGRETPNLSGLEVLPVGDNHGDVQTPFFPNLTPLLLEDET